MQLGVRGPAALRIEVRDQNQNKKTWKPDAADKIALQEKAILDKLCDKCYNTIKWKLDYGKYNKIGKPAKCVKCLLPTIVKSYRTVCDKCAVSNKEGA